MSRPYVNIAINNKINHLLKHLESIMQRFKSLPGVVGITLNGGLSRGYADHLSEIDVTFYLDCESYKKWQTDKGPIPLGIAKFDNILYDIKIINYEVEDKRKYGDIELWDLSYAKILFDTDNQIAELFEKKLSSKPNISEAHGLLWEAYWNFKLAGDIWINRGDALQGHFVLNEAIKPLVKALFIANKEYIPHEKWLIHMSRTLHWTPDNWEERLMKAMNTENLTIEGLIHRQSSIESLFNEIDNFIKTGNYTEFNLACHQKPFYDLLKNLVQMESISIEDWKKISSLSILNMEPFHRITEIYKDMIVLKKERLLSIKAEDLYSWHYEIVRNIIKDLEINNQRKGSEC